MTIATLAFWKATAERALSTVAQTAAALIAYNALPETMPGVVEVDWLGIASASAVAGILAVLKAMAATGTGNGPSLTNSETLKE
jgi:hypothetical protein